MCYSITTFWTRGDCHTAVLISEQSRLIPLKMMHLKLVLLLAIAANFGECKWCKIPRERRIKSKEEEMLRWKSAETPEEEWEKTVTGGKRRRGGLSQALSSRVLLSVQKSSVSDPPSERCSGMFTLAAATNWPSDSQAIFFYGNGVMHWFKYVCNSSNVVG